MAAQVRVAMTENIASDRSYALGLCIDTTEHGHQDTVQHAKPIVDPGLLGVVVGDSEGDQFGDVPIDQAFLG